MSKIECDLVNSRWIIIFLFLSFNDDLFPKKESFASKLLSKLSSFIIFIFVRRFFFTYRYFFISFFMFFDKFHIICDVSSTIHFIFIPLFFCGLFCFYFHDILYEGSSWLLYCKFLLRFSFLGRPHFVLETFWIVDSPHKIYVIFCKLLCGSVVHSSW